MLKSKHSDPARDHALHEMHRDSISVKPKPLKKVPLVQVEADIRKYIACVHSYTNKYERNRTECVHQLRELITSLERKDFLTLGEEALTRTCDVNNSVCVDERNLFIDLIAREGSAEAQLLVLEHVMSQPNVTEEDLRRCLFHAIALQSPVTELVSLVEKLCFEDGHEPGETPALTKTRKRACLSLGALAKSLHDLNTTVSDRIVERIENWLDHHNETRSSDIIKPRRRRSIIQHDTPARKHIETKMVLLQSLGNAGKQRSLRHIMSYMAPNVGVTAWRRAAINGLRHFSCNKSADALLTSIIHDHDEVVRKTAHTVFKKHPKSDDRNFTIEHETEVISKNYTYPIVSRVRRSLLQALEEGIRVTIQPPGIDWQKTIGTENIGASFGLIIRNTLDLKLALLSGHFMVDVYDGAYAEAHVGMIGFKIDIVKAYVCFKGHIEYDLNVLKDFGINSLSDLVQIFDKIMDKIVNPIINAIEAFKQILTMVKGGKTLTKVVNEVVDIVKNLPTRLGEVANRMRDFVKELFSISANTIIEEIKSIVKEVSDFIDGIKNDALKFYNDVVDVVTMALPYTAKKIMDAFNSIVEAVGKLFQNPIQAMTSMSRAIIDIKVAVTMAIDVKNKVVEACLFIKGRVVEWINAAKKIPAILGRIKDVFKKLTDSIKDGVPAIKNEAKSAISDGISAVKDTMHDVVNNLKGKWDHVFEPLQPLIEFVTPFVEIFKSIMDAIKGVKWGYQNIKKVIETSKSFVQKVFGPKFDRNFPTKRRDAFEECPSGVWPSTANGAYGTTGVDIILEEGQTVHMPVNGILKSYRDEKKVVVKPSDPEFALFEIVVENIDADQSLHEKTVKAGEKIGKATTARVCKERKLSINVKEADGNPQDPNTDKRLEITIGEAKKNEQNEWMSTVASRGKNSIHVSVRKAQEDELPDADYDYTDPSPFLDRVVPIPKWIQDCNDHEFRYIGQTFESGESDEDVDPDKKKKNVGRRKPNAKKTPVGRRKPNAKNIDGMLGDEDTKYRPDDPSLYDPTSFGDSLKESLKEQAKQFAEMFKQALFGSNPKIPNILEIVDVNSKTVDWIIEKLNATSEIGKKFIDILRKLACSMKAEPSESSATLTPNLAINFLKLHNFKFNFGGFDFTGGLNFGGSGDDDNSGGFKFGPLKFGDAGQLSLSMAELPGKLCPMFKDGIAKGFGHICYVHEDCLGLSCNIRVPLGPKSEMLHASIALVPSELKIEISVLGRNYTIQPNGEDQHMEVANFLLFKVLFIVNAKIEGTSVTLTAEIQLCNDLFMTCMPPIELFHNLNLMPNAVRHKRATGSCTDVSIRQTPISIFMMQLSEFYLLNKDVTATLENVRHQVVDQLLKDMADKFMAALTEFPDKVDFCVSANIPVPPFDITFFNIRQHFMVGPVPLSLGMMHNKSIFCLLILTERHKAIDVSP
ncbi:uncharacterized protein LOC127839993 [Dreissena polymorpha]|nr:uncharacterized protein LOC127839993 [Dreissena polymorpha]